MPDNKILNVTSDVKWIGVLDPSLKTFDIVVETKFGTTYNSYFINAKKKTIVDAAKSKYWDIYKDKILQVVKPEEIQYLIVNHTEPDHSGCVKYLIDIAPDLTIVGSANAIRYLRDMINIDFKHIVVRNDDTLDLGDKTLKFISAPNLHWPDSMFTWLVEDKVLFTCDCFASHYCDERMFDDLMDSFDPAFEFYFDVILKPFSKFMLKAISKIHHLPINAVCPGHGPILRSHWKKYIDLTEKLSLEYLNNQPATLDTPSVFIPYISAYNYTQTLAIAIADGIKLAGNINVDVCNIEKVEDETISSKLEHAAAIIIGSPTINQNTLFPIYKLFALMNPVRDAGKLASSFGSFGWSGESSDIIESTLKNLKFNLFPSRFFIKFNPSDDDLVNARKFGKAFGEKLLNPDI